METSSNAGSITHAPQNLYLRPSARGLVATHSLDNNSCPQAKHKKRKGEKGKKEQKSEKKDKKEKKVESDSQASCVRTEAEGWQGGRAVA